MHKVRMGKAQGHFIVLLWPQLKGFYLKLKTKPSEWLRCANELPGGGYLNVCVGVLISVLSVL